MCISVMLSSHCSNAGSGNLTRITECGRSIPEFVCQRPTVLGSKVHSTAKKYTYASKNWWRRWADGFFVFPIKSIYLALYIQHLGDTTRSCSAVGGAVYAISWIDHMAGLVIPQIVLAGLCYSLARRSPLHLLCWSTWFKLEELILLSLMSVFGCLFAGICSISSIQWAYRSPLHRCFLLQ